MSDELHAKIRESKQRDTAFHGIMNSRKGSWALVNGQLAEFGRSVKGSDGQVFIDETRIRAFVPMRFKL